MGSRFYILLGLFYILLYLFYMSQFSINSHLTETSTNKLIANSNLIGMPKKVIFIVIDSLRYDYLSKLPFIGLTLNKYPSKSFAIKCKVGNPTMTTQRVESLMTGSQIFSQSNIFKSFFASKVSTDNLISQLNLHNKSSIVFGDDTWVKLFEVTASKICTNTYNVHDYDSCDKTIYDFMMKRMLEPTGYDFIVAHFLALDHVGHSTSTIHSEFMKQKMEKISNFIEQIISKMDEEAILFVTGDHGMRTDGNHGGSSQQQVETLFFGFNKRFSFYNATNIREVSQSDITATLSLYLDVPLPSNSVGIPIMNALPNLFVNNNSLKMQLCTNIFLQFKRILTFYRGASHNLQDLQESIKKQENIEMKYQIIHQFSKELSFLKYSTPNETLNLIILIFITIIITGIALLNFKQKYVEGCQKTNTFLKLLYWSNNLLLSFILFGVFFSWYLIQNLSNIFLITILSSIVLKCLDLWVSSQEKIKQQIVILLACVFILCQTQPQKTGQYSTNFLRLPQLHEIFLNYPIKIIFFALFAKKLWLNHFKTHQNDLNFLEWTLILVSSMNYFLTYCFNFYFYLSRIAIIILSVISVLFRISLNKWKFSFATFQLSHVMLLFFGQFGPILLLCCQTMIEIATTLDFSPLFFSFLAEALWWFMGNRFEYSGVDAIKSYIFSQEYNPTLNGISLFIYVISPYLTVFLLRNFISFSNFQSSEHKDFQQQNNMPQPIFDINEQQETIQKHHEMTEMISKKTSFSDQWKNKNKQFIIVSILGLLSCVWNVDYNNSKILFTIVYIPMLLFSVIKVISVTILIILTNFIISKIAKNSQKRKNLT